jgi:hypothetical protein
MSARLGMDVVGKRRVVIGGVHGIGVHGDGGTQQQDAHGMRRVVIGDAASAEITGATMVRSRQ